LHKLTRKGLYGTQWFTSRLPQVTVAEHLAGRAHLMSHRAREGREVGVIVPCDQQHSQAPPHHLAVPVAPAAERQTVVMIPLNRVSKGEQ
jgi:hypothetical protein